MAFEMTAADYAEYIKKAYALIHENGDYVTELDLATGGITGPILIWDLKSWWKTVKNWRECLSVTS